MIDFIRKNTYQGVSAYDDSVIYNHVFQNHMGVLKSVYNQMACNTTAAQLWNTGKIVIESGHSVIYGRQWRIREGTTEEVTLTLPASGSRYFTVYAKMDLANGINQQVTLHSIYDASAYPDVPLSDNLIQNQNGEAKLGLYHILVNASSQSTITITPIFELLKPIKQYVLLFNGEAATVNPATDFIKPYRNGEIYDWSKEFRFLQFQIGGTSVNTKIKKGTMPIYDDVCICNWIEVYGPSQGSTGGGYAEEFIVVNKTNGVYSTGINVARTIAGFPETTRLVTVEHNPMSPPRFKKIYGIY